VIIVVSLLIVAAYALIVIGKLAVDVSPAADV
jgi:hypothetical protein